MTLDKRLLGLLLVALTSVYLVGCSGLGYTPPPGAKLGDGFLSLTISTVDKSRMPQGADVVISIENPVEEEEKKRVIIGDVIKLSLADTAVKINFPIDQHLLKGCGASHPCQINVKIVKSGQVRYQAKNPVPFKAGQKKAEITVAK